MTPSPRDRLRRAAVGKPTDRPPVVLHMGAFAKDADGFVFLPEGVDGALRAYPKQAVLSHVRSPFARALDEGMDLLGLLDENPSAGEAELERLEAEVRRDVARSIHAGADGIFYFLAGAHPGASTPMQYGGHFLEVDRSVLSAASGMRCNIVWVEAPAEPFLDFVSDLPCHALGWDVGAAEASPKSVRELRGGPVACAHPDADIYLVDRYPVAMPWLASRAETL